LKLNCIIIDDEPLARKGLKEYISDVEFLNLVNEFDNPVKAMDCISKKEIHLIFLDIQMPKLTGLEFLKTLKNAPPVIFTTAFPQFALEGFELNALDYLVKPVSYERFLKAVVKAREYYEIRQKNVAEKTSSTIDDHFFIKADNKLVKIFFNDILFAEGLQNYVVIHTREKKYITYLTFKSLEEYLPSGSFIRTHKSYIVSASKVDSIEGNELRIIQHHIPISRNLKEEVMEKLLNGKFLKR
jgi:DNA-binding LytR/AlgR family response regulator